MSFICGIFADFGRPENCSLRPRVFYRPLIVLAISERHYVYDREFEFALLSQFYLSHPYCFSLDIQCKETRAADNYGWNTCWCVLATFSGENLKSRPLVLCLSFTDIYQQHIYLSSESPIELLSFAIHHQTH